MRRAVQSNRDGHRWESLATGRLAAFIAAGLLSLCVMADDPSKVVPRNIQFSNLTTEIGLSSEFVHDVAQDGMGYLWFATQSGLNRFDGHQVQVYENISSDPTSLGHSFVWSLYVDSRGALWVGTERGVNRYVPETDQFVRQPWEGLNLSGHRIRKIIQDRQGVFWLGTLGDGLLRVDPSTNELEQFVNKAGDKSSLSNDYIIDLLEDSRDQLWIGTDGGGLVRFDETTGSFFAYRHDPNNPLTISDNRIRSIYEDRQGGIWTGTASGGLNLFEPRSGRFTRFLTNPELEDSLPAGQVSAVFEDNRGTLWVGTENGLAEWRPAMNGFVRYTSNAASRTSLANNRVNAITQDVSGVLWLATHGGVSSWNYFSDTFKYYSTTEKYLQSDLVTAVAETSDGVVWVGTYGGGLSSIDPLTDTVTFYRYNRDQPDSLPDDRVMALHVDDQDRVWVGTRDGGLALKDTSGSGFARFVHDPDDPQSLSGNAIASIFSDLRGALWVGVFDGGVNVSHEGDAMTFEHFRHIPGDASSLSGDRVLTIYQDQSGAVWLGTESAGLNRFDVASGKFTHFDLDADGREDGPHGTPWEIHESRDGTMWIGTLGQGLFRWSSVDRDAGRASFEQFAVAQGLASEIYGIVEGPGNKLWLSSNRGLFRFDMSAREVRKFDHNNGLRTNEFNQGAAFRSRSGRLFFGSTAGLVGFFPGELPDNGRPPMISVEARSRTETIARTGTGQATPAIRLNYFDAFVMFDFVALDFTSPDKNEYRYRLNGLDNEWTDVQGFRRAVYSSLLPGDYTFEVQASNNDGVWNRAGAEVDIYVVPPPWSTWWAYLIYGLVAAALVGWYLMNQRSKQLAEAETRARLEQLVTERTAELADRNTDLMELNKRLEQASVTDALTGLHNRRFVDEHIASELSMLRRLRFEEKEVGVVSADSPRMLFLMMVDLDGFKAVNDTYGHHAGDRVLLEVKDRLLANCRMSDVVIRWGGDEFLIIGHARTMDGAEQFTEKIRTSLASPDYDIGNGHYGRLSGSIGISSIPFVPGQIDFAGWEQVCNVADLASYIAKDSGRNSWVSITGTVLLAEDEMADIKERLAQLIKDRKLRVTHSANSQPFVNHVP